MLQRVDMALHEAKKQGRNNVREYHDSMANIVSSHLAIQSDLSKALENNEFLICYQAKIANNSGKVSGFEALLRWNHPQRGWISPNEFIPVAEETGQIVEIGAWVMEAACKQNREWQKQGLVDVRVAVNVTARQLRENNFIDMVKRILTDTELHPDKLELEMTESTLMTDPQTEEKLMELRKMGISIALDDFGTGYSSLSYITQFPIDTIKIDRSFVKDIALNSNKAAIVSAVTNLSHKLSFNVIAEGVETQNELDIIQELNCDEVQGFFYSEPALPGDMDHWLKLKTSLDSKKRDDS
jgi:EAL domain-containing protein (putative c-di-GMP-specific phosphodiesterase class I)